jgi:hypothetical protein
MNKRGQTFLIIALVIVGIIIGLSTIYTKTRSSGEETRIVDLSSEIYYEGAQIVDSGVFNKDQGAIKTEIDDLILKYSQINPDSEIAIVYGDGFGTIYRCEKSGSIRTERAGQTFCKTTKTTIIPDPGSVSPESITVTLDEQKYSFNLEEGQNFFLVIKKETGAGEEIIAT